MSDYAFWYAALAGKEPETTPGTPHAGFYKARRRVTTPNPNPRPGDPRRKVRTYFEAVAIWHDADGWHCTIHGEGEPRYLTNQDAIDTLFSYCCRSPLTHDEYTAMLPKEMAEHE